MAEIKPQWQMHCSTLKDVLENGFDPARYRKLKTQGLLGEKPAAKPAKKTAKKTKEPKPEKVPTNIQSLRLYQDGLSIRDIAKRRGLGEETIWRHLMPFVKTGEVDIHDFVSEDHFQAVTNFYEGHPSVTMLTPCYEALSQTVPYDEIRAIRDWLLELEGKG